MLGRKQQMESWSWSMSPPQGLKTDYSLPLSTTGITQCFQIDVRHQYFHIISWKLCFYLNEVRVLFYLKQTQNYYEKFQNYYSLTRPTMGTIIL